MAEDAFFGPAPWLSEPVPVAPEWIDRNGHMNVGYYAVAFDNALDGFLIPLGIDERAAREDRMGPFALQSQYHHLGELRPGDSFRCAFRLLDHDAKRLHLWGEMENAATGELAATLEQLLICADLDARRSRAFPAPVAGRIARLAAAHADLPRPSRVGAAIGIRRPAS